MVRPPAVWRDSLLNSADLRIDDLRVALSGRVIGRRIDFHQSLPSTMDEARRLAEAGMPEGTVVLAEEQTAARGRFDRVWISPVGVNLSFSVILRPGPDRLPQVNMAAALAVSRAVERTCGLVPSIKWPNDVRLGGRKVAGILVESVVRSGDAAYAVAGIGINVNFDTASSPEIASTASSIMVESGRRADRGKVLRLALEGFDDLYGTVSSGGSLTRDWAEGLETLGRHVRVEWKELVVEGRAESVDEQGNLLLRMADGSTFTASAGEVTLQARNGHGIEGQDA